MAKYKTYRGKRFFDVGVALLLLVFFSPLLLLTALIVWLVSGSPIIYHRKVIGLAGKSFSVLKFRTMVNRAEASEEKIYRGRRTKPIEDSRITGIGRILRRTSLDELPQLINVLRGEMSLVGPRPMPEWMTEELPEEARRVYFSLIPGITGLPQVIDRSLIPYSAERIGMENKYYGKMSFLLDCQIFLRTIFVVIAGQGAY